MTADARGKGRRLGPVVVGGVRRVEGVWGGVLLAVLFSVAALIASGGAQTWIGRWPTWALIVSPCVALIFVAAVLWERFERQRRGTLYAIEALGHDMVSWHRDAEDEARHDGQDYRPIYRGLPIYPGVSSLDLVAEMEDLRRAIEVARQTDDEATGISVAPNMLWWSAFYLGFMVPLPENTTLVELSAQGREPAAGRSRRRIESVTFTLSADAVAPENMNLLCGCIARLEARHVDPRTGRPADDHAPGDAVPGPGDTHVFSIELTGLPLEWALALPVARAGTGTRVGFFRHDCCVTHATASADSDRPLAIEVGAEAEMSAEARDGSKVWLQPKQVPGLARWTATVLADALSASTEDPALSKRVVLRTRGLKTFGFALGAYVRQSWVTTRHSPWNSLVLLHEAPNVDPVAVRAHPAQPELEPPFLR